MIVAKALITIDLETTETVALIRNCTDQYVKIQEGSLITVITWLGDDPDTTITQIGTLNDDINHRPMEDTSEEDENEQDQRINAIRITLPEGAAIPDNLKPHQKRMLEELIIKYRKVFDINPNAPPATSTVMHKIDTEGSAPVATPQYRMSPMENENMRQQVRSQLSNGIIQPSKSPWCSPVLMVKKKDSTLRMCIDFRRLNKVTKKDTYPLPRIDDSLNTLNGARWFSGMDLAAGYWQVLIDFADREKTAFPVVGEGFFEWVRMPFGLCNAPATFQRMMDHLFRAHTWKYCLVYFDDILVYTKTTFKDHIHHLEAILKVLSEANLSCKISKCNFARQEVEFLGHIVSRNGIHPDPKKVLAITSREPPKDVDGIRSFLGFASYYRRFIKDFASVAAPMVHLTRNNVPFVWGEKEKQAFDELKHRLVSTPIVRPPDFGKQFFLQTDASKDGIGAVLTQFDSTSAEFVVEYASRTLTRAERNYATIERECLAVVWAVRKFRPYLFGSEFIILSDHKPLQYLNTSKIKDSYGRLTRWTLQLQDYTFQIQYRKGVDNGNADALSRHPVNLLLVNPIFDYTNEYNLNGIAVDTTNEVTLAVLHAEYRETQRNDPQLGPIIDKLENDPNYHSDFKLHKGILFHVSNNGVERIVVPQVAKDEVLSEMHGSPFTGHLGISKTHARINKTYYWRNMSKDIAHWVNTCDICLRADTRHNIVGQGPLMSLDIPTYPFEFVGVDCVGPFPKTSRGNKQIIVFTDYLTRWPEAFALPDITSKTTADCFIRQIVCRYGAPTKLLSDQGPNFTSELIKEICRLVKTKKIFTTPYNPQCNGLTERFNKTLIQIIRKFVNAAGNDWDTWIPYALFAYRTAYHSSFRETPFYLLYGRQACMPHEVGFQNMQMERFKSREQYIENIRAKLKQAHQIVQKHLEKIKNERKETIQDYEPVFKLHDLVYVHFPSRKKGMVEKFRIKWRGPYRIIEVRPPKNFVVELVNGRSGTKYLKFNTSLRRLKSCPPLPNEVDKEEDQNDIKEDEKKQENDNLFPEIPDYNLPQDIYQDHHDWVVETIIDKRTVNNVVEYLVKWQGNYKKLEWVKITDMNCEDMINDFESRLRISQASSQSQDINTVLMDKAFKATVGFIHNEICEHKDKSTISKLIQLLESCQ